MIIFWPCPMAIQEFNPVSKFGITGETIPPSPIPPRFLDGKKLKHPR
jgi:hypothetical protein